MHFLQVGEKQQVLVTEESFDHQYYVAHNCFYEQVIFQHLYYSSFTAYWPYTFHETLVHCVLLHMTFFS